MQRDWESKFREWAKPPGTTEESRCVNALSAIRNAIDASDKLKSRNIKVFCQGSYRNNTNVRKDSDIDVGVLCKDSFFYDLPPEHTETSLRISPATYLFPQFKNEVEEALTSYFGKSAVTRGNKAFDLHETSYHVDADIAPFFEHRRYLASGNYLEGVELRTDNGDRRIKNWPEQHYQNGVQKNKDTRARYKGIVRVLKALSNEMTETNIQAGNIPGFLNECLVWNIPNSLFQNPTYAEDLRSALVFLYQNTESDESCKEWGEVSELIYLFHPGQKWTRAQVNDFIVSAWSYAKFEV
jgi:hypothetical protein